MGNFIITLSVVEWTDGNSNPETCDALTFNLGIVGTDSGVVVEDFEGESIEGGASGGSGTQSAALLQCFDEGTKEQVSDPTSPVPEQAVDTERP
ncbi:hypothetical protein B9Z19DRAFT_1131208 [Tuber borchii]|uniref:Uncharacterized protein n=1 Tax=Tuber borchii TaxID=42251 RepID=A0A2T6ZJ28_TUBBO|nr:hypothetical protein B9Z19DRAFT_1131208 [Tuber borchii]